MQAGGEVQVCQRDPSVLSTECIPHDDAIACPNPLPAVRNLFDMHLSGYRDYMQTQHPTLISQLTGRYVAPVLLVGWCQSKFGIRVSETRLCNCKGSPIITIAPPVDADLSRDLHWVNRA